MASNQPNREEQDEASWYEGARQALQAALDAETANHSDINMIQMTEKSQGSPDSDKSVQVNPYDQLGQVEESSSILQRCDDEEEDLLDFDQDELMNPFECEYCGASLLPDNPDDQPLEYCKAEKCGMPSGIPTFADWDHFCNAQD